MVNDYFSFASMSNVAGGLNGVSASATNILLTSARRLRPTQADAAQSRSSMLSAAASHLQQHIIGGGGGGGSGIGAVAAWKNRSQACIPIQVCLSLFFAF